MKETVRVDGLKELDQALGELPRAVARGVLRRTGLKALEPFLEDVKSLAPIDADPANTPKRPPGTLRDSYVSGPASRLNPTQRRLARKESTSFVEVYAGTNDPAGIQTEFGNVHQAAQPHARTAWDGAQGSALEIIKAELGGEIERTAERLARRRAARGL